jgi:DNA-binding XRE family transcriptional regulator
MRRPSNTHLNTLWIARKRVGLGQKSAWRLGHKTASTISEYETGHIVPNLRTALELAAIYRTPVTDLYVVLNAEVEREVATEERKYPGIKCPAPFETLPTRTFHV